LQLKASLVSLGCAKNLVDSEVMLGILAEKGFVITGNEAEADVIIVNTCGFIGSAKEESINTILDLAKYKEDGNCKALVVTGCLGKKYKDELKDELPEVDAIIGTNEVPQIAEVVEAALKGKSTFKANESEFIYNHELPRVQTTPTYSAYVKIADGCDNCCSYCVIPEMRGKFRSRPLESIVKEVEALALRGVKEINLIAQDSTRYGEDLYGHYKLAQLLQELNNIEGIVWIRILYCYPTHFNDELIETMAKTPKVCKYLDLPLQHADNDILRKMNRKGTREDIINLIHKLREFMPDITLRTSFIVGLPGETETKFQELLDFIQDIKFDRVGVFTYSREEGTPAYSMEQVPDNIKEERYHQLMSLQREISLERNRKWLGKKIVVLVEGKSVEKEELCIGRTEGDAPEIDGNIYFTGNYQPGDFVTVKVIEAYDYDLLGEVVYESGQ